MNHKHGKCARICLEQSPDVCCCELLKETTQDKLIDGIWCQPGASAAFRYIRSRYSMDAERQISAAYRMALYYAWHGTFERFLD